jgi:2-oxoglutarate dehydrogenase E2 component (dihydrolipoamide succinyltransferase)
VGVRRVPRHELSPRARRRAEKIQPPATPATVEVRAEQSWPPVTPTGIEARANRSTEARQASFAVGEFDVDVTALRSSALPYAARAAAEAMPSRAVHLAIGVGGPVIRDAGDLSVAGLTRRLSELDAAAKRSAPEASGAGLPDADRSGATLTIVESGLAAETVPPEPGQLGTLVVGEAVERPAVVRLTGGGSGIAVRSFARLTFSYDHRALRRDDAVRFLTAVKHRLEAPWTSAG